MTHQHFDVVIIGGGPAGSVLATQLANQKLKVLLLEQKKGAVFKVGESLSPAAAPILKRLGILSLLEKSHHLRCYGNQSSWGNPYLEDVDFIFNVNGYGWHLNRVEFDIELLNLAKAANAVIWQDIRAADIKKTNGIWELSFQDTNKSLIQSSFVVDATGRSNWLLRKMGIEIIKYDNLLAFTCLYHQSQDSEDEDSRTLIEAVENGWWYSALLPGKQRVVSYFTDKNVSSAKLALSSKGFDDLLRKTIHVKNKIYLENYHLLDQPFGKAANSTKAKSVIGDGWLAIGDAACSFDPLSSQGIISAIENADYAAKAILGIFSNNSNVIQEYQNYINLRFLNYLENQAKYYKYEQRWSKELFWKKMHNSEHFLNLN